jgi:acylphosphatase
MNSGEKRAEIIVKGLVQGVGFRYFVLRHALKLGLKGYVKNLYSGDVFTVVEGSLAQIEALYEQLKIGPSYSSVRKHQIIWSDSQNEFTNFEIRH